MSSLTPPLCPRCVEGYELPEEPLGSIQADFQGAYLATSPATASPDSTSPARAVVLLTDGFGLPLKNCKIIADKIAAALECDVWVPDYFAGKPLVTNSHTLPDRADQKMTALDWIKFIFINGLPNIPRFISNRPSVVDARLASFFALLKQKKSYSKIGAVGYCYGGSTGIRLASTDSVHSVVICHPGSFSLDEVRAIKVPISWACPEADIFLDLRMRFEAEAILAAKKDSVGAIDYEFVDYPGTTHGFASRPNLKFPEIKDAHEKALEQTIAWFRKTLV